MLIGWGEMVIHVYFGVWILLNRPNFIVARTRIQSQRQIGQNGYQKGPTRKFIGSQKLDSDINVFRMILSNFDFFYPIMPVNPIIAIHLSDCFFFFVD